MTNRESVVELHCHPDTPCAALRALRVGVAAAAGGGLALRYRLIGATRELRLPAAAAPEPADGLWAHTCCEAFVARAGTTAYREFNFSPSGQWAAYAFRDYRQREAGGVAPAAPGLALRRHAGRLELEATLGGAALPPGAGALELGLAAVIEEAGGGLSYWALAHGPGRPDFHRRASFTLRPGAGGPA